MNIKCGLCKIRTPLLSWHFVLGNFDVSRFQPLISEHLDFLLPAFGSPTAACTIFAVLASCTLYLDPFFSFTHALLGTCAYISTGRVRGPMCLITCEYGSVSKVKVQNFCLTASVQAAILWFVLSQPILRLLKGYLPSESWFILCPESMKWGNPIAKAQCGHCVGFRDSLTLWFCYRTSWVKRNGVLYKPSCVVVLRVEDEYPMFGQIKDIYVVNSYDVYFRVKLLSTDQFNSHCHSYFVSVTSDYCSVQASSLLDVFPLYLRKMTIKGKLHQCITVKHHILHSLQV